MKRLILVLMAMLPLLSCSQEIPEAGNTVLTLNFGMVGTDTKSSMSWTADDSAIHDINLYVMKDGVVAESRYLEGSSVTLETVVDGSTICFYAIANAGKKYDRTGYPKESLESMELKLSDLNGGGNIYFPAAGCSQDYMTFSSTTVSIKLRRLVSRVSFTVNDNELVSYDISGVTLYNTPSSVTPFKTNVASSGKIDSTGDAASPADLETLNSGGRVSFFVAENAQGCLLPSNTDPWAKIPDNIPDRADVCTYLQVDGSFGDESIFSGNVTYRFYLGEDNTSDFSLFRNTDYMVRLILSKNFQKTVWKVESNARMVDGLVDVKVLDGLHKAGNLYLGEVVNMGVKIDPHLVEWLGGESVFLESGRFKLLFGSSSSVPDWKGASEWIASSGDLTRSSDDEYGYQVPFKSLKLTDPGYDSIRLYLYDSKTGAKYPAGTTPVINAPYVSASYSRSGCHTPVAFPIYFRSQDSGNSEPLSNTDVYLFFMDSSNRLLTESDGYGFTDEPFRTDYPISVTIDLGASAQSNIASPVFAGHSFSESRGRTALQNAISTSLTYLDCEMSGDAVALVSATPSIVTSSDVADALSYSYRVNGASTGNNEGIELKLSSDGLNNKSRSVFLDPACESGVVYSVLDLYHLQSPISDNAGNKVYFGTRYCPISVFCRCSAVGFCKDPQGYNYHDGGYCSGFTTIYWYKDKTSEHTVDYTWGRSYENVLNPVTASIFYEKSRYVEASVMGTKQIRENQPYTEESSSYYGKNVHIQAYALSGAYLAPESYERNYHYWDESLAESGTHGAVDFWKRNISEEAIVYRDTHTGSNYRLDTWLPSVTPKDLESLDNPAVLDLSFNSAKSLVATSTKPVKLSYSIIFHGVVNWRTSSGSDYTAEPHELTMIQKSDVSVSSSPSTLVSYDELKYAFDRFNRGIWRCSSDNWITTGANVKAANCIPSYFILSITGASTSDGTAYAFTVGTKPAALTDNIRYVEKSDIGYLYDTDEQKNIDGTDHYIFKTPNHYTATYDSWSNRVSAYMANLSMRLDYNNLNVHYRNENY